MKKEKFKGIILEETMKKILAKAVDVHRNFKTGETTYWNGKNLFVIRRKSQCYWNVYMVTGI